MSQFSTLNRPRRHSYWRPAAAVAALLCALLQNMSPAQAQEQSGAQDQNIWTCSYIATTPRGPLQITAKFKIVGDELAEIETNPPALNFSERYKILEDTEAVLIAAISIDKLGDNPPPGIGALIVIIAKQNGLFQQSGSILGVRTGAPTLGHCERQ
jgi:hypothetical protein